MATLIWRDLRGADRSVADQRRARRRAILGARSAPNLRVRKLHDAAAAALFVLAGACALRGRRRRRPQCRWSSAAAWFGEIHRAARMDPDSTGFSGKIFIDVDVRERTTSSGCTGAGSTLNVRCCARGRRSAAAQDGGGDADGGVRKLTAPVRLGSAKAASRSNTRRATTSNCRAPSSQTGPTPCHDAEEPLGARSGSLLRRAGIQTPWDISLVVPEGQTAIANTPMVASTDRKRLAQTAFRHHRKTAELPDRVCRRTLGRRRVGRYSAQRDTRRRR